MRFDTDIKSDWLSACFTFVTKSPGLQILQSMTNKMSFMDLSIMDSSIGFVYICLYFLKIDC